MGFTRIYRSFGGTGPHIPVFLVSVAQLEEQSPVKGLVAGASPVGDPV